jgi:hypothetical protein
MVHLGWLVGWLVGWFFNVQAGRRIVAGRGPSEEEISDYIGLDWLLEA